MSKLLWNFADITISIYYKSIPMHVYAEMALRNVTITTDYATALLYILSLNIVAYELCAKNCYERKKGWNVTDMLNIFDT